MKNLDFLIIGAQKAGTTSLFKYLQPHPQIYLPPEKEIPFFTRDGRYVKGWSHYAQTFYRNVAASRLWGKATPDYLADPRAAGRIRATMPDVKLVVLLRHPVERAVSHYKMIVRRGQERRSLDEAMTELVSPNARERARHLPSGADHQPSLYLAWGEYGRLLETYLEHFSRSQLLILFTEHLAERPQRVVDELLTFLGLEADFVSPNLGRSYHVGGSGRRLSWLQTSLVHNLLRRIPGRLGVHLRYWTEVWNVAPVSDEPGLSKDLRTRLLHHFRPDVERLIELTGVDVPWPGLCPSSTPERLTGH